MENETPQPEIEDEPATPPATAPAQAHAEELGVDLSQVSGTGKDGTITKADVAAAAPAAAAGPSWVASLEPAPTQASLAKPINLYDVTTGAQVDMVPEGPFQAAFKTVVEGIEYLVHQAHVDAQLPLAVKADEVAAANVPPPAPAPPPPPAEPAPPAEWETNLQAKVQTFSLNAQVHSFDMVSGDQVDIVAEGPLTTAFTTKAGGTDYLVTQAAYDARSGHGIKAAAVATATAPAGA